MSEKLEPCPFCGNGFPTFSETQAKGIYIRCPNCNITFSRDYYESGRGELGKQRTIEAWNRRAAPKANEPLTLEELRRMDGKPVWAVLTPRRSWELSGACWVIVEWDYVDRIAHSPIGNMFAGDYGNEWLAYRRPPKGEAK